VELNIVNEVAALQRLSVGQLRQRFAKLFGETTKASNRTWLIKRIMWRMQALAEGDLSERARRRAAELARDADLRLNPPQRQATTTMRTAPFTTSWSICQVRTFTTWSNRMGRCRLAGRSTSFASYAGHCLR
jgi:hypothetical protein